MRISEITVNDLINYCKIDEPSEQDKMDISNMFKFAKTYICNYTGLDEMCLDEYEDLSIAIFMLVCDFYDNRNYYSDYKATEINKTVDTILNMHCTNLV